MKFRDMMIALGFKNWAKDAKPEEIVGALDELSAAPATDAAKDAAAKAAADAAAEEKKKDEAKDAAIKHASDCPCKDCMAKAKDEEPDDSKVEKIEEEEKANGDKKGGKDEAEILPAGERGQSVFHVGDAAALLSEIRPLVAHSKDPKKILAFNTLARNVKSIRSGVKDGAPDPFEALTKISNNGAKDSEPEIPMFSFFNGKSYAEGLKAWNEYQKSRGER